MKMIVLRKVVITFIICFSLMPAQLEKVEFKHIAVFRAQEGISVSYPRVVGNTPRKRIQRSSPWTVHTLAVPELDLGIF
jgi:hypothetical protein